MNIGAFLFSRYIKKAQDRELHEYVEQFMRYLDNLGIDKNLPVDGEDAYMRKWSQFGVKVEPYSYRLYSRYCGQTADIVPEAIGRLFIESVLNPPQYTYFYGDKNAFRMYIDADDMPKTILSRIGGAQITDAQGEVQEQIYIPGSIDVVILKPAVASNSGKGIQLFTRTDKGWFSKDGTQALTLEYLKSYRSDFILQEVVKQHPYISRFCQSSVNTFRVAVYRSVKDDSLNIIGAVLRIGSEGKFVDNGHAGGRFAGIDLQSGRLNDYVCDSCGNKADNWNGLDFKHGVFIIPQWDEIKRFAIKICRAIPHMRLVALDICLDETGTPKLIEFNVEGFSYWLFMFSGRTPFGEFTDEIIDYSKKRNRPRIVPIICR